MADTGFCADWVWEVRPCDTEPIQDIPAGVVLVRHPWSQRKVLGSLVSDAASH